MGGRLERSLGLQICVGPAGEGSAQLKVDPAREHRRTWHGPCILTVFTKLEI